MKRGTRMVSLLLAAMLVIGMTACGGEKAVSSAPAETASNAAETTPEAPKDTPTTGGFGCISAGICGGAGGTAPGGQLSAV